MAQIIIAPSKYIQGTKELNNIAGYVSNLGKKILCLVSESGLKRSKPTIEESIMDSDLQYNLMYSKANVVNQKLIAFLQSVNKMILK